MRRLPGFRGDALASPSRDPSLKGVWAGTSERGAGRFGLRCVRRPGRAVARTSARLRVGTVEPVSASVLVRWPGIVAQSPETLELRYEGCVACELNHGAIGTAGLPPLTKELSPETDLHIAADTANEDPMDHAASLPGEGTRPVDVILLAAADACWSLHRRLAPGRTPTLLPTPGRPT